MGALKSGPPAAAPRSLPEQTEEEVRVGVSVLCHLQQWEDCGEGAEIQGPGNPIPTRGPWDRNWNVQWGVGSQGRRDAPAPPPRGRDSFLFVLSSLFFKKHKHMAADGAGAVFGWCIRLPFAGLSVFFRRLQHPAGTQGSESEALPQHPKKSSSFQWVVLGFPLGKGLENLTANPGLSFAEVWAEGCVSRS